jgi:ABC-type transport system involved in multi-copper enzyme maturation permease subunit
MNAKVFENAFRLGRIGLLWYAVAVMLPIFSGTLGQSAMQDQGAALGKVIEGLPPAVLAMFKINLSSFSSPIGYMCARGLSLLWPIVVIAFAAGSAGGISTMIERGTIHFELSLPVSRTRWYQSRILAGLLGLVVLMLVTFAVLSIAVPAEWWRFMMLGLAFGILWLGVGYAVAAFARDRGLVTGVVFGFFGLQFLLATLASTVSGADWLANFSLWSNYQPESAMNGGVPWGTVAVWTALGVLGFGLALWRWRTRDIPA